MNRPYTVRERDITTRYDRRVSIRHACHLEVLSRSLEPAEGITWGATVEDLSRGGLRLHVCYPFRPGTYLAVELRAGTVRRTLLARVVHVEDIEDGAWEVGCEFAQPLADEDVALLL